MATIEELVEGALGELGYSDCKHTDAARAILSRLAAEARLGALREGKEQYFEAQRDMRDAKYMFLTTAIEERFDALIAATETPRRGR